MMTLLQQARERAGSASDVARRGSERLAPHTSRVRNALRPVSGFGWTVLLVAVACWILGAVFSWVELVIIAACGLVQFIVCALMTIGRTRLQVFIKVDPQQVTVGNPSAGQVHVINRARGALLPIELNLPIGPGAARFDLPTLRSGSEHEELFVVPTDRRGVVPIGPARTVRGDPLGLVRREVAWTDVIELFVHPLTVGLEPLGAGLLRDLEGQTTNDVSMSDLAFHALRDYAPGDDRRYIHWRSSAKAGRFMVRQFLDTRRSHFVTVVDSAASSYADPEDYELAISVAASIAVRAVLDDQDFTVVAGDHAVRAEQGRRVLDVFARAELGANDLGYLSNRAVRVAPDASVALLISGAELPFTELRRAASHFPRRLA